MLRSPQQALLSLENTISEMTGPVFGHDKIGELDNDLIRNYAKASDPIGPRIIVYGRVLDENSDVAVVGMIVPRPVRDDDVRLPLADHPRDQPSVLQSREKFAVMNIEHFGSGTEGLVRGEHLSLATLGQRPAG